MSYPFAHLDADALECLTCQIEIEARHARAGDGASRTRIAADYRSLLDEHARRAKLVSDGFRMRIQANVSRGTSP